MESRTSYSWLETLFKFMLIMKAFYTTDSNKKRKPTIMLVYYHLPILYNKVEISQ